MIEKLEIKNTFNRQPALMVVLADKLNQIIDTVNEQQKQIDFIMENAKPKKYLAYGADSLSKTLKELYKERSK